MGSLFNTILYQPLFNALIFFYDFLSFHDLGISIVLLTILIRLILFPLFHKGSRDQAIIQRLTPKIKEIQHAHKHDKEKQARALMELYREHKVNPISGFLLLLIQLPVLIALYRVFLSGISADPTNLLYSFIPKPGLLNHYFLGFIDLTQSSLWIALVAALGQYFQGKLSLVANGLDNKSDPNPTAAMQRQMLYLAPALTFAFLYFFKLPAAVGVYWLTTVVFSIIQQMIINRSVTLAFNEKRLKELKQSP